MRCIGECDSEVIFLHPTVIGYCETCGDKWLQDKEEDSDKYYWYVSFSFQEDSVTGNSSSAVYSSMDWFPIKDTKDFLTKNRKYDIVVINNWKSITKEQYEEFSG